MSYEQILTERRGPVLVVTLNRPEKLNAWTRTMGLELMDAIESVNADPDMGAVVLTGAGRAYCAGADISGWSNDLKGGGVSRPQPEDERFNDWIPFLQQSKPVIAAVNGTAVGIGLTHILPVDIRVASDQARFGAIFVKMGVVPELGSTYFLPQIIGLGATLDWCLTARIIDAQQALAWGLVSRVVPHDQLLDETVALATQIANLPGPQIRMTKQLFAQNAVEKDSHLARKREGELLAQAYASPEFKESVAAFMEKRTPDYRKAAAAARG